MKRSTVVVSGTLACALLVAFVSITGFFAPAPPGEVAASVSTAVSVASRGIAEALSSEPEAPNAPHAVHSSRASTGNPDSEGITAPSFQPRQDHDPAKLDYDALKVMATAPIILDADRTFYCLQLNPRNIGITNETKANIRLLADGAKKKGTAILNMLGHVRGVEMADLMTQGRLRRLGPSLDPALYQRIEGAALRRFPTDHPDKARKQGWETSSDFTNYVESLFGNAVQRLTRYTQSITDGKGNTFVASIEELPNFRSMMLEGAIQIVSAELAQGVLCHYQACGSITNQERESLWARFSSLLSSVVEAMAR